MLSVSVFFKTTVLGKQKLELPLFFDCMNFRTQSQLAVANCMDFVFRLRNPKSIRRVTKYTKMVITVSQSTLTNNLSPELYLHVLMHKLGKQCIVVKQLSDCAITLDFPMKCLKHLCSFHFL